MGDVFLQRQHVFHNKKRGRDLSAQVHPLPPVQKKAWQKGWESNNKAWQEGQETKQKSMAGRL